MNYVKIKSATISPDGTSMEVSFKDEHGCSQMTIVVPASEWLKGVTTYKASHSEKWYEMQKLMESLQCSMVRYVHDVLNKPEATK